MFLGLGSALFFLAFYILVLAFMFWMMVDSAKHDRFWWIVIIIALPLVGALIYYAVERKHLYKKMQKGPTPPATGHHPNEGKVDEVNGKVV